MSVQRTRRGRLSRRNRRFLARRFDNHPVYRDRTYGQVWQALYRQASSDQETWKELTASSGSERDSRGVVASLDSDWSRFGGTEWWSLDAWELARARLLVEFQADILAGGLTARVRARLMSKVSKAPSAAQMQALVSFYELEHGRRSQPAEASARRSNISNGHPSPPRHPRSSSYGETPPFGGDLDAKAMVHTWGQDVPPTFQRHHPGLLIAGVLSALFICAWLIYSYSVGPVAFEVAPGRGMHVSDLLVIGFGVAIVAALVAWLLTPIRGRR